MRPTMRRARIAVMVAVLGACICAASPAVAQRVLTIHCSHDADACELAPNVVRYTQSGTAQGPSVARGEVAVGVTFAHEFVTQQLAGFKVDIAIPCEGTGAPLGGMAIVAGAPHPGEAKLFYDWALTRQAQELANRTRNLIIPANASATIRPEAARFAAVPTLDVDPARFGQPEQRRRLLARWQREIDDVQR